MPLEESKIIEWFENETMLSASDPRNAYHYMIYKYNTLQHYKLGKRMGYYEVVCKIIKDSISQGKEDGLKERLTTIYELPGKEAEYLVSVCKDTKTEIDPERIAKRWEENLKWKSNKNKKRGYSQSRF